MMSTNRTGDTQWLRALTLTERIPLLRAGACAPARTPNGDSELARQRLRRWRSQKPFTADKIFAQRMEMDSLTEEDFLHLLGRPVESLGDGLPTPPAWVEELQRIFPGGAERRSGPTGPPADEPSAQGELGFLAVFKPLIDSALDRLRQGIQSLVR